MVEARRIPTAARLRTTAEARKTVADEVLRQGRGVLVAILPRPQSGQSGHHAAASKRTRALCRER
jgi:hypothetical protein